MRQRKKRTSYTIFLWIAILLLIYLCYIQINRSEVGDTHFAEILCIDEKDGTYTITALYENAASKNNDGLQMIDGTGDSVYTAYTDMSRKNTKDISLDHTAYFILGQTAAIAGLDKCLDFISREPDMKTNAKVFIMKSDSTNKLFKDAMEDDFAPSETLESISTRQSNNQKKPTNTLLYVLNDKEHTYNNLLIPYLVYKDKNMYLEGYAAFKEQKLVRFLDYDLSRTIDLYRNNLRTCPLQLNPNISVELQNIEVKPTISVSNEFLSVDLNIKAESTLKETTESVTAIKQDTMTRLNALERRQLMNQLIDIILVMKKDNLDLLNIGSTLEHKIAPAKIEENWKNYLDNMDVSLSVDSATAKTYTIETN